MIFEEYYIQSFGSFFTIIVLIIILNYYNSIKSNDALNGSSSEIKLENKRKDISDFANYIRALESKSNEEVVNLKKGIGKEILIEQEDRKNGNENMSDGEISVINMIDSLETEKETEKSIDGIASRSLDVIVEGELITSDLENIDNIEIQEDNNFFLENKNLENLCVNLEKLTSINQVTSEFKEFLNQIVINFSIFFNEVLIEEKKSRSNISLMIKNINSTIKLLKQTSNEILINKKTINRNYICSKKKISKAFSNVRKFILSKKKLLIKELAKSKKSRPEIVLAVTKEIEDAQLILQQMQLLYNNLNKSFSLFEENYSKLTNITNNFKSQISLIWISINNLNNFQKDIGKNFNQLDDNIKNIDKSRQMIYNEFVYKSLNEISNNIVVFYNLLSQLFEKDIVLVEIDKGLTDSLSNYFLNINNSLLISKNLLDCNESIQEGVVSILELMKVVIKNKMSSQIISEVSGLIITNKSYLLNEEKIFDKLSIFDNNLIVKLKNDHETMEKLIPVINRKIEISKQIGEKYGSYIGKIAQILAKTNNNLSSHVNKKITSFNNNIKKRNDNLK